MSDLSETRTGAARLTGRPPAGRFRVSAWIGVAVVVLVIAAAFVLWAGMRPGYDAYGWLVWGRQTLHWDLNTDGAPSWKPLTFLFTLPYALTGAGAVWLWMVTAVAGGLSGCVFAGRIAYKLTGPPVRRRWAPAAAAAFAAIAVVCQGGFWHLLLIANSDPLIISLCLAAIDAQLCGRSRLAFGLLILAALGRPEVWLFTALFALWTYRTEWRARLQSLAGLALIPLLWFSVPALTSKSWLKPGDLALNSARAIHGSKITGVLDRFLALSNLPIQLAALLAIFLAIARRDRRPLLIAGAAVLWLAVEIAFALHGWSAAPRYLGEPAALVAVLAGVSFGQLLSMRRESSELAGWAGALAAGILLVSVLPADRGREQVAHREILAARPQAIRIRRLEAVIARDGGGAQIRACGQPVSFVAYQSTLAYYVGLNVGNVGYNPGHAIGTGKPLVVFEPSHLGWRVRPSHPRAGDRARCERLRANTAFR